MIRAFFVALWRLKLWEFVPKLPRGMLAERYNRLDHDERRVLARLGARSPNGVQIALRRARVGTVPELVQQLEHYSPRRRIIRRFHKMIGRAMRWSEYKPYRRELYTDAKRARRREVSEDLRRIDATIQHFKRVD